MCLICNFVSVFMVRELLGTQISVESVPNFTIQKLMRSVLTRDKPELKRIKTSHRKVSRLDLFFDLMYVLLIRDLFHMMVGEVTLELFWKIALIFIPVWLIRQGYNFYIQRFEETTVRHRMLTFLLMACVGAYSFSVHEFGLEITPLLLGSTMMGHGVIAYMFLSAVW